MGSEGKIIVSNESKLITNVGEFGQNVINALNRLSLPTQDIFTDVSEKIKVFKNLEDVVNLIDVDKRVNSFYISKFVAAVAAGLFDAALNYLWDETILQLRIRVSKHDIDYFFDCAVKSVKRNRLKDNSDLDKVDDSELLNGAKDIGLINNIGYNLLMHIKFMRNWVSAAHPNNSEITGLQLISWLETCIKEVICLPLTSVTVEINKLLNNVKTKILNAENIRSIKAFFATLPEEKISSLSIGLFGIYTRLDTGEETRKNIIQLIPELWINISEEMKNDFGIKYAQYSANGDQEQAKLSRSFLQICNAERYIPDDIRAHEIHDLSRSLYSIHLSYDNFYNEPVIAKQILNLTGGKIPKQCEDIFIKTIVYVFITNGNGVASIANDYYLEMINQFNEKQSMKAVVSIMNAQIASKMAYKLCKTKYIELLNILSVRITQSLFKDLINEIKNAPDYSLIHKNPHILQKVEIVRKII